MSYGFIGCGNMGSAILKGMLKSEKYTPNEIYVYEKDNNKAKAISDEFGVNVTKDLYDLCNKSMFIFLAVKPNIVSDVSKELKEIFSQPNYIGHNIFISMVAGIGLAELTSLLPSKAKVIRIMPNLNAQVCGSVTAYAYGNNLDPNVDYTSTYRNEFEELLNNIGIGIETSEKQFEAFTAIAGCSPAYVYLFADSLARGGLKNGISKEQALEIAVNTILGCANLMKENLNVHPIELMDKVCSPGGVTIKGVSKLMEAGFESAVINAVDATINHME